MYVTWLLSGSVFSRRHHLVFGNPTSQSLSGITEAAERGILVPAIGRTVPLSEAVALIAELERTGSPKGKLVIVPDGAQLTEPPLSPEP